MLKPRDEPFGLADAETARARRDAWVEGVDPALAVAKLRQRRRRIVRAGLVGAVLALAAGLAFLGLRPTSWRASAELLITNTSLQLSGQDAVLVQLLMDGAQLQSQLELARSQAVMARTVQRLGPGTVDAMLPAPGPLARLLAALGFGAGPPAATDEAARQRRTRQALRANVRTQRVGTSQIIAVVAHGASAQAAADLANAVARDYIDEQRDINAVVTTSGQLRERIRMVGPTARIVSEAVAPDRPGGPGLLLVIFGGLLAGAVAGMTLAGASAIASGRIVAPRQVGAVREGLECLGVVPLITPSAGRYPTPAKSHMTPPTLYDVPLPTSIGAVLRRVRAAVTERGGHRPRVIAITSVREGEGKTTLATGLVRELAAPGRRVLLVDACDPDQTLTVHLTPEATVGWPVALRGPGAWRTVVWQDFPPGFDFLPGRLDDTTDLDALWPRLLKVAEEGRYDRIVIDAPPADHPAELRALGAVVDDLVIVVEWGRTRESELSHAIEALGPLRDRLTGVVINKAEPGPDGGTP